MYGQITVWTLIDGCKGWLVISFAFLGKRMHVVQVKMAFLGQNNNRIRHFKVEFQSEEESAIAETVVQNLLDDLYKWLFELTKQAVKR